MLLFFRDIGYYKINNDTIFLYSKRIAKSRSYWFSKSLDADMLPFTKPALQNALGADGYQLALRNKKLKNRLYW